MEEFENNKTFVFKEELEKLRILLEKKREEINNFVTSLLIREGFIRIEDKYIKNFIDIKTCSIHIDFYIKEIIENIEELDKMETPDIKNLHETLIYPGIKEFIWKLSKK